MDNTRTIAGVEQRVHTHSSKHYIIIHQGTPRIINLFTLDFYYIAGIFSTASFKKTNFFFAHIKWCVVCCVLCDAHNSFGFVVIFFLPTNKPISFFWFFFCCSLGQSVYVGLFRRFHFENVDICVCVST